MVKGLVTVVLPVYNVEKYLDRCVFSIVNQSYSNLEIILVDDGSPDNCPQMCEDWARKDSRIKVVHKKNAGLGMARNTGIENANGEYICFFDSDDYIALNTVEKIMISAEKTSAEIISFGHYNVDKYGQITEMFRPETEKDYYEGEEVCNILLPDLIAPCQKTGRQTNLWMSAWSNVYSCSLIQRTGWRFVSEREYISEDVYSLLCLMKYVNSFAVIPEAFYYYCENGASLTHQYRRDRYDRIKAFYDACIEKCDEMEYKQDVKGRLSYVYISNVIGALKALVQSDLTIDDQKASIKEIIADEHMQHVIADMNIKKQKLTRKLLLMAFRSRKYRLAYWMIKIKS